jgi:hypothetical protein
MDKLIKVILLRILEGKRLIEKNTEKGLENYNFSILFAELFILCEKYTNFL